MLPVYRSCAFFLQLDSNPHADADLVFLLAQSALIQEISRELRQQAHGTGQAWQA